MSEADCALAWASLFSAEPFTVDAPGLW